MISFLYMYVIVIEYINLNKTYITGFKNDTIKNGMNLIEATFNNNNLLQLFWVEKRRIWKRKKF